MMNDKMIELPDHGRLIVVTDLHGNFDDYNYYLNLWDESDPDFHIVFCGEMMQSPNQGNIPISTLFWETTNGPT